VIPIKGSPVESALSLLGVDPIVLLYGNTNTGVFSMVFYKMFSPYCLSTGSAEYTRKFNQYIGWVNGEE
jgi:hypothetical protein